MRAVVAQARLLGAAAVVSRNRHARLAGEAVTREPRLEDTLVAGVPTMLARPPGPGRRPAVVFANGVTARGRDHPAVVRLAYALARTGHLVAVPDPPGLAVGEIADDTVAGVTTVAGELADLPDCAGGRVALLGVSVGASLALLAAEQESLAERVSLVAGFAPYTDLARIVQLATTGWYPGQGAGFPYPTPPFLLLVVARSLAVGLPSRTDRALFRSALAPVGIDDPDPLAGLRTVSADGRKPAARALRELLLNTEPDRFGERYAALPAGMRAGIDRLSPMTAAAALRAPVEIATAPQDKYFPVEEMLALQGRAANVRVTVTATLAHAIPELSAAALADLLRLDGWGVRVLAAMR